MARTLTADELDEIQEELARDLSRGYGHISDFMSEVEVPRLEDIMDAQGTNESGLAKAA